MSTPPDPHPNPDPYNLRKAQLEWEKWLIATSLKYLEDWRYANKVIAPGFVEEIKRVGEESKKDGSQFKVTWPGRFTLLGYPKNGRFQFIPHRSKVPPLDSFKAFMLFLCGGEPLLPQYPLPPGLQRLHYTREQAVEILENLRLSWIRIERGVLSDPYNQLPNKAAVTQKHPPLRHLPKDQATLKVNESDNEKEIEYSGTPNATLFMHLVNHESGTAVDFIRQELDHNQQIEEQVNQLRADFNDHSAQVAIAVEDTQHEVRRYGKFIKTLNKDTTEILKRLPTDLSEKEETRTQLLQEQVEIQKKQLEAQRETTDKTSAGLEDIRGEIRYGNQEQAEFLRRMMAQHDQYALNLQIYGEGSLQQGREIKQKVDQIDLHMQIYCEGLLQQGREIKQNVDLYHKGIIFQTEFFARRVLELRRQLEQIHMEVQGIYRIREEMRETYSKILAILDQVPQLTAAQLAALFNVKPNKMHYWLKRLRFMHLVDRDQKDPDINQEKAIQSPELSDSHAKLGQIRKIFHYFLSKLRNQHNNTKNKQKSEVKILG